MEHRGGKLREGWNVKSGRKRRRRRRMRRFEGENQVRQIKEARKLDVEEMPSSSLLHTRSNKVKHTTDVHEEQRGVKKKTKQKKTQEELHIAKLLLLL